MNIKTFVFPFFLVSVILLQGCGSEYSACIKKLETDEGSGVGQIRRLVVCGDKEGAPKKF